MTKFYTFVESHANKIFHRYIEDGKSHQEVVREFPIKVYANINTEKTDDNFSVGLRGERLVGFDFNSMADAREYISLHKDAYEIHGQTNFVYQFISNEYRQQIEFDQSQIKVAFVDIECNVDEKEGFPHPAKANQEITAISMKISNGSMHSFGVGSLGLKTGDVIKTNSRSWEVEVGREQNGTIEYFFADLQTGIQNPVIYYQCADEENLLLRFISTFSEIKPDIISGWNIIGFDIPYLINRGNKVVGKKQVDRLSPFYKNIKNPIEEYEIQNGETSYRIFGVNILDYIELYKKFSTDKLESYSLNFVSHHELQETKIDYSDVGSIQALKNTDYAKYVLYNIFDVLLVEKLESKLSFINIALTTSFLSKARVIDVFSPIRLWDSLIYNVMLEKGIQIPPNKHHTDCDIEGGFVKEPIPGLYKWVVSFDLTSLYPSIIMMGNLSPETIVSNATGNHVNAILSGQFDFGGIYLDDYSILANGSTYRKDKLGILPEITKDMFNLRKTFKKIMLGARQKLEYYNSEESPVSELTGFSIDELEKELERREKLNGI